MEEASLVKLEFNCVGVVNSERTIFKFHWIICRNCQALNEASDAYSSLTILTPHNCCLDQVK
jgi:hypothetical protein